MNNQFILPPIFFIIFKIQKSNIINMIKLILSLNMSGECWLYDIYSGGKRPKNMGSTLRFK